MVIAELDKATTILNKKETNGGWKELNSFIIYLCVVKLPATPANQQLPATSSNTSKPLCSETSSNIVFAAFAVTHFG